MSHKNMGRFSDIYKGPELNQQFENLQNYLRKSKEEKQTAYAASLNGTKLEVPRTNKYIIPFGQNAEEIYVRLRVIDAAASPPVPASDLISDLATYIKDTPAAGSTALNKLTRLVPALLKYKILTGTASAQTSRFTNATYKSRSSDTVSCPFGKSNATDTEQEVTNALITKANTWVGANGADKRFYFRKEGYMGI